MYKSMFGIKNRMLLFFLAVMLLPIITLGMFANIVYSKVIEKNVNKHTYQMIEQIEKNIEDYLKYVEDIIFYISESTEVIQYMTEDDSIKADELENEIRKSLSLYREANPEILGILIANENDKYLSNELEKNNRDSLTIEQWYKKAVSNKDTVQYISNPIGRNISAFLSYGSDEIISISKAVKNKNTNEVLGVILLDINLSIFEEIIKDNNIGEKGFFYILDEEENIIYSPINNIIYRIDNSIFNENENMNVVTINNETFKIMFETSSKNGWKTIGVFSLKDILKDVTSVQKITIIIAIITLILAITSAILFTNTIVTPVKELNSLMRKAEQGDLEVVFDDLQYNDEIGELGHSFNHMIREIKDLINMVYEEQRSKRKAELEILQAQIKPHFLYNTLDTISWMAEDYNAKDIVQVVTALTNVFRIGLNKGRETIEIGKEVEHIRSYMIIQKYRYEDKLDYKITCDEELINIPMLKLTTQPIVENAIYHGVKQKRGKGYIEIDFSRKDNNILISVTDTGAGMNRDKLYEINSMLESESINSVRSENGSGYGIYNVNSRIRLTYGGEYGLKYYSEVNKGTRVEIVIPILGK